MHCFICFEKKFLHLFKKLIQVIWLMFACFCETLFSKIDSGHDVVFCCEKRDSLLFIVVCLFLFILYAIFCGMQLAVASEEFLISICLSESYFGNLSHRALLAANLRYHFVYCLLKKVKMLNVTKQSYV